MKGIHAKEGSGVYTVRCGAKEWAENAVYSSSGFEYRVIAANPEGILFERGTGSRYEYYMYDLRKKRTQPFRWRKQDGRLLWTDEHHNFTVTYKDGMVYARGGSTARQVLPRWSIGAKRPELLSAGLSIDMKKMAVSNGEVVVILDTLTGKVIASVDGDGFAWSPRDQDILALSSDGIIRLYRVGTMGLQMIAATIGESGERVLCWHPQGRLLLNSCRGIDLYRLIPEACMLIVRDADNGLQIVQRRSAGGWGCYSAAWIE